MVPEWLSAKDNYIPKEEKNLYIEKSVFSLIKIVSIIRQNKNQAKLAYSINLYLLNPNLKVVSSIVMILCISISRSYISIYNRYICAK